MKTIHLKLLELPPEDFTGIAVQKIGTKIWYLNGLDHREDGPAIENYDGSLEWRCHGVIHRLDGPAVIELDGQCEYWINGSRISSSAEYWRRVKLIALE